MTDTNKRIRELLAEYTQATPRIGHLITLEIPALLDENESLKAEVERLRPVEKWFCQALIAAKLSPEKINIVTSYFIAYRDEAAPEGE